MALTLYNDTDIQSIANAIRTKNGSSDTYKVSEMAHAIEEIETGSAGDDTLAKLANKTLVKLEDSNIRTITQGSLFNSITTLTTVSLPNLSSISAQAAFANCTKLSSIYMPKLSSISTLRVFSTCSSLVTVVLPSLNSVTQNLIFEKCTKLKTFDCCNTTKSTAHLFNQSFFSNSTAFDTLIVRCTNQVASMGNINCFENTCFKDGGTGGTLYVPQALISSYQSATNWSTILGYANNQILPIEGSEYEHYYADGTPISA